MTQSTLMILRVLALSVTFLALGGLALASGWVLPSGALFVVALGFAAGTLVCLALPSTSSAHAGGAPPAGPVAAGASAGVAAPVGSASRASSLFWSSPKALATPADLAEALALVLNGQAPPPLRLNRYSLVDLLRSAHQDMSASSPFWLVQLSPAEITRLFRRLPHHTATATLNALNSTASLEGDATLVRDLGDDLVPVLQDPDLDPAVTAVVWDIWDSLSTNVRSAALACPVPLVGTMARFAARRPLLRHEPEARELRLVTDLDPESQEIYFGLLDDDLAQADDISSQRLVELTLIASELTSRQP